VPTAKFLAMYRGRLRCVWPAIALIHPAADQALALLEDDRFMAHLAAGFAKPIRNGQRVFDATPKLDAIADREAGMCILFSVMLRDAAGETIAIAPLAREFSVSRAHIRSILQAAEALGLLARSGTRGDYRLEPEFKAMVGRFMAALFQHHIHTIDRALAACAAELAAPGAAGPDAMAMPAAAAAALGATSSPPPPP
jgi:hypothetical protein